MLARRGIIASAILRPVVEVLVAPGDRVTKGQVLIKLFDLEPQAKIRAREKELRSIEARAEYSRRNLDLVEKSLQTGALPGTSYNDVRSTALYYESQMLAAEAELSLAQSELKLYTVTASIDGEVAWLDVSPGTVTWPGTLIWGEIVDLRELDVRCELSPVQAEQVAVGQSAEVWLDGKAEAAGTGKVVFVGKVADRNSGLVPVVVRVANSQGAVASRGCRQGPLSNGKGEMIAGGSVGRQSSYRSRTGRSSWSRQPWAGPPEHRPTRAAGARGTRRRLAGSSGDSAAPSPLPAWSDSGVVGRGRLRNRQPPPVDPRRHMYERMDGRAHQMTRDHMLWSADHHAPRGHAQVGRSWSRFCRKAIYERVCQFGWEKNPHLLNMSRRSLMWPGIPR